MSYITYPRLTPEEFRSCGSECEKYRSFTAPYCTGAGVDVASQGVPVVPWAISFDLPINEFLRYSGGNPAKGPIHLRGHAGHLPFENDSLDFVFSSHLLEDFSDRLPLLHEWNRVLKIGGHIIILVPDEILWKAAIDAGQPPNCSHKKEFYVGELSEIYRTHFGHFDVLRDHLTAVTPTDYTILFVARRLR